MPPLLRTDDYGQTWKSYSDLPFAAPSLGALECAPDGAIWVYDGAFTESRLHVTADEGVTWASTKPIPMPKLVGFCPISAAESWAISEERLFHTTDGGNTWVKRRLGEGGGSKWRLLAIGFHDRSHGLVLAVVGHLVGHQSVAVFTTEDGGRSFHMAEVPESGLGGPEPYRVHRVSEKEGWIATSGDTLLHTRDGGQTWSVVSPFSDGRIRPATLFDVAFPARDTGWAVGSRSRWGLLEQRSQGVVLETHDGGKTWRELDAGVRGMENSCLTRVVSYDSQHVWLRGDGGLHANDMRLPPRRAYHIEFVLRYEP